VSEAEAVRAALRERVARRVAGSGISPRAIERAVDAVVAALPPDVDQVGGSSEGEVVIAIAARSVADLGSRVRAALEKDGVRVSEVAVASAGQHTVVTLRAPAAARDRIARIAEAQKASFTILDAAAR
jgi:hypothetical protein